MGFLRKTFYTLLAIPPVAMAAEHFYTRNCVLVDLKGNVLHNSPLIAKRTSENLARFDRYERVVPLTSLVASIGPVSETSLVHRIAKQVWLTRAYAPQRVICHQIFKSKQAPGANLTVDELERAKLEVGYDVLQHLVLTRMEGTEVQFDPIIPPGVEFYGPGGVIVFDVERRGENMVFGIECASVGLKTEGRMKPMDELQFFLHKMYARLLLEDAVRRVLEGKGE